MATRLRAFCDETSCITKYFASHARLSLRLISPPVSAGREVQFLTAHCKQKRCGLEVNNRHYISAAPQGPCANYIAKIQCCALDLSDVIGARLFYVSGAGGALAICWGIESGGELCTQPLFYLNTNHTTYNPPR